MDTKVKESDVQTIRNMINQNTDLSIGINTLSEKLHMPLQEAAISAPDEPTSTIGEEFITMLKQQRRILESAREALQGFNG